MFKAPKLEYIDFGFASSVSIESNAISHLPSLTYFGIRNYNMENLTLPSDSLNLPENNNFHQLDIEYTTPKFQPGFITNLDPTTLFNFQNSNINTLDKDVFYDIFNTFATCAECDDIFQGHIISFEGLNCDCNIWWILEDPTFFEVIRT